MTTTVQVSAEVGLKWIGEDTQEITTYSDPNTVRDARRWVSEPNGTLAASTFVVPAGGSYVFVIGRIDLVALGYQQADQASATIMGFAFRNIGNDDLLIDTDSTDGWKSAITLGASLPAGGTMIMDTEDDPWPVGSVGANSEILFSNSGASDVTVEFIVWGHA